MCAAYLVEIMHVTVSLVKDCDNISLYIYIYIYIYIYTYHITTHISGAGDIAIAWSLGLSADLPV